MKTITFTEFRKNASSLFSEVENGEKLIVLRHGKAVAEIIPPVMREAVGPSWKKTLTKLTMDGSSLSKAILQEREIE